jgi:hypothetical protein
MSLIVGAIAGLLAKVGLDFIKAGIDFVETIKGRATEALIIKSIIDLGLAGYALVDVIMHPKDDFWKAFEWVFGVLQALTGAIGLADAVGFKLGLKVPGLSIEYEKKLLGLAMGREPVEMRLG